MNLQIIAALVSAGVALIVTGVPLVYKMGYDSGKQAYDVIQARFDEIAVTNDEQTRKIDALIAENKGLLDNNKQLREEMANLTEEVGFLRVKKQELIEIITKKSDRSFLLKVGFTDWLIINEVPIGLSYVHDANNKVRISVELEPIELSVGNEPHIFNFEHQTCFLHLKDIIGERLALFSVSCHDR